jgi:hypothetical protein
MMMPGWRTYQWTAEKKKRLLVVNDALEKAFAAAWDEAMTTAAGLESRITSGEAFLLDYEIDIEFRLCIKDITSQTEDDDDLYLDVPVTLRPSISHCHYEFCLEGGLPLQFDKSLNWNSEYFNGEFDDEFIGYSLHCLLDGGWCFDDILSIKEIWTDVNFTHQNWFEV